MKHPVLLPVDNAVELRIRKAEMYLRDAESGDKEA